MLETQILIRCGLFDSFELTRPELLWRLAFLSKKGGRRDTGGQELLLLGGAEPDEAAVVVPRLPEYPLRERLELEMEHFGFTATAHPLALHDYGHLRGLITAERIARFRGRRVRIVGRPISRKRIRTGKGAMMFLSLDDRSAAFEVVIFADCYKRYATAARGEGPFVVVARVQEEHGVFTLVCEEIRELGSAGQQRRGKSA